ncbi:MAG: glutamate 5-kinase [Spirochaetes bacterium GWF1_51_8]|nr:MAG: glutamate 5-kinase [Spirochaetes bacterium GWF1_51_8]
MRLEVNGLKFEIGRAVIKLGTKQVTDFNTIDHANLEKFAAEVAALRARGVEFILTASGAIGLGRLQFKDKLGNGKLDLSRKQALAGVGQIELMELFKQKFAAHGIPVGQVLLTHAIFDNRNTYLNARNTLNTMLEMGIVPVINENDSVAVEEIRFGDNDRLGALVALLTDSDLYIMLSDIDGFYSDYGTPESKLMKIVNLDTEPSLARHAGDKEFNLSTGGMVTKLEAARLTNLSCVPSVIANGFKAGIITAVMDNLREGTIFISNRCKLSQKKRWISAKRPRGKLVIDDGAVGAVRAHKSLLPSGIRMVEGKFLRGDLVLVAGTDGAKVAAGLVNFDAGECAKIAGHKSAEIEILLGEHGREDDVIHIDNMVVY